MSSAGAVAAVDCGTNSTRLLVLGPSGERLARAMTITRLGAGIDATGRLDPAAIERTLVVLAEFRQVIESHGVVRTRAAATSATRDAANAADFLDPAGEVLGVRPEVIEGSEEGRLSYLGATASLPPEEGPYLVVDIGGGSTELIVGGSEPGDRAPAGVVSLDMGCVRLTERYLAHDPPLAGEIEQARAAVRGLLDARLERPGAWAAGRRLIGLAGTVSALTVMALGLPGFEEERVHHAKVSRRRIGELTERLASLSVAERKKERGMELARADVIVGGALILEEVMDSFSYAEMTASESDILDGIALELLS